MRKVMVIVLLLLLVTVVFVAGCSSSSNNQPSQPSYGGGCGVSKIPSSITAKAIDKTITNENGF